MRDETLYRIVKLETMAQPVFFSLAGLVFGRGMGLPPVEIPITPSLTANVGMGSFLASLGLMMGAAFGGAISTQIVADQTPKPRPIVDSSTYYSTTQAIPVSPGEWKRANIAKEFGFAEWRVKLFAERLLADREFATRHYADVAPDGRKDYDKFTLAFSLRKLAVKGKGSNGKWYPTPRGLKFAGELASNLSASPTQLVKIKGS